MRRLVFFSILLLSATAAERQFPKPCNAVFPLASAVMTEAGFQVRTSDAAGGVLALDYKGAPMVYSFFVKNANPFVAKYVEGGDKLKNKLRGLSYGAANFAFTPDGDACKATVTVGLAGLDSTAQRGPGGNWERVMTAKPLPSNGTAEAEFLDRIAARAK